MTAAGPIGPSGPVGTPAVRATSPTSAVSPSSPAAPARGSVAERVADRVLAHPDVVRLAGGAYGSVTTYLPGRRLVGVSLGEAGEPTRVGIVVRLGARVRPTADAVRRLVAAETGAGRVDVLVTDVEAPVAEIPADGPRTVGAPVADVP